MASPDQIILPTREPDMDGWDTDLGRVQSEPDSSHAEGGRYWHIASDLVVLDDFPSQTNEVDPDLVTCWLLEGTQQSAGGLISPYAKLEVTREFTPEQRAGELLFKYMPYRFRLVNMEEAAPSLEAEGVRQPKVLNEYKLLAGAVFECVDDADVLLLCHAALSGFRVGKMTLRDPDEWENFFRS